MTIVYTLLPTDIGNILTAETREGLVYVAFGDDGLTKLTDFAKHWLPGQPIKPSVVDSILQIQDYLSGQRRDFDLKPIFHGTEFQKTVWQYLLTIPYGQTMTYTQVAQKLQRPNSARAVGQACGANPMPLVVPCHRVLSSNGGLGGYAGGTELKQKLLDLEQKYVG